MIRHCPILLAALFACLTTVPSLAGQLGDAAPPLSVDEWVKGNALDVKDGKHIYVLEFCSLARASDIGLTNLSAIQQKFKDKDVLALAICDDPPDELKGVVKLKGAKINYLVAADKNRRTTLSYLQAFEQMLLPHAFVIGKDGKVLWHGHPLRGLEQALEQITAGHYDLEAARKNDFLGKLMEQYLALAHEGDPRAARAGSALLGILTNNVAQLCNLAFQIATDSQIKQPDYALAGQALDHAEKVAGSNNFSVVLNRAILLFQTGKQDAALVRAREAVVLARTPDEKDDAQNCLRTIQNRLAADKNKGSKP